LELSIFCGMFIVFVLLNASAHLVGSGTSLLACAHFLLTKQILGTSEHTILPLHAVK
jgi:hypothetical protein